MMRILSALVLMTAVGCSGKSDDTGTSDDTDSSGAFTPTEGSWTETSNEIISDTCGIDDGDDSSDDDDAASIVLAMTDEDSFTFSVDDAVMFECELSDQSFTCTGDAEENDMSDDDINAVLIMTPSIEGEFESADSLTLTYTNSMECSGDDCDMVSDASEVSFPCEFSGMVTAIAG